MKVFITWSGLLSRSVAKSLRDWLRLVIHGVDPFMSEEDVAKGTRGLAEIADELEAADVGIICVTRENFDRAWINFEAGALSKKVGQSKVIPFLVDLQAYDLPRNSPLTQFQATLFSREDVLRMVESINRAISPQIMDDDVLNTLFDEVWHRLETSIQTALTDPDLIQSENVETNNPENMLGEILDLVRNQNREIESMKSSLHKERPKHFVFVDELPSIPQKVMEALPPIKDGDILRTMAKLYYLFSQAGQTQPSGEEFNEFLLTFARAVEEAVGSLDLGHHEEVDQDASLVEP